MSLWIKLVFFTLLMSSSNAYEKADAFIVKIYDERVRVLSPVKYDPKLNVIIENKTLVDISGKVETGSGEILAYVTIKPAKAASVNVKKIKDDSVFFIPLSPPSQKVELKLGSKPYEIPPR